MVVVAGLAALILVSFYHDVKQSKIPNRYTVAGIAAGVGYHAATGGWDGLAGSLFGFAAGFGIMLALYLFGAVGAGDVKLFGAIGAMAGGEFVINGALNSILFAAVIGLVLIAVRKQFVLRLRSTGALLFNLLLFRDMKGIVSYKKSAATFPFMYAVLPAMIFTATYCNPSL
ncbi:A24 family peptidase [Paenibacillus oceani]|uniref:Prepilin peptidase n=1 Tax=Paenibacillus oceani TaxID=2772510 RepID=A0A927H359_9BACL|nr:A24 family peptidase [Paenibacillus oceani]MBD2865144.1 prepilin peptidase [Paenibacillus oceani]